MWWPLFLSLFAFAGSQKREYEDLAARQLALFEERNPKPIGTLTTVNGAPVEYEHATKSLNSRLIYNSHFMEKITHLNRRKTPERTVHAKGAGAFGHFEVTHDITDVCKAKLFDKIGKKTPIAIRFSTVVPSLGSADTFRDARGFAVKFYTEDGNWDLVGLSTPIFPYKDPLFFPTFARSQGKNPATNIDDPNMLWDYITLRPESIHFFMYKLGDYGIPRGYRHVTGFSVHTFQIVNELGESTFVRFHFIPDQGIEFMSSEQGAKIGGTNPDYFIKDLYNAIANGDFPSWLMAGQFLSLEDVKLADFDVFDVTKELPLEKYPLRPIGKILLNKNPVNFVANIEQIAMNPDNLVPGILGAPDKLFEARRLSYRDAQYYRLGANFFNIEVNCPFQKPLTYNRDGVAPLKSNEWDIPNYYPNSYNGPIPFEDPKNIELIQIAQDTSYNFEQASKLYDRMSEKTKSNLIGNILAGLSLTDPKIQERAVKWFTLINEDFGTRVESRLALNFTRGWENYHH